MSLRWDTSEVDDFALDLSQGPGRMQRKARKVFAVGMFKAKTTLKEMASGHDYLPDLPRHIEYDELGPLFYELGINKVGQGNLGNFAVYGGPNNAPIMGSPADAMRIELPSIVRHLADEAEDVVLGGPR